jgi:S-adenosylmethionine hydrolase
LTLAGLGGTPTAAPDTVFFLSDYGLVDEFVGVVHAVLRRLAPRAAVVDLTHGVAPFDVAAGARTLVRALPHLGPGVVLAVVDPGVGGARRGVALEVGAPGAGPRWFVGPDNGLLVPAADASGGVARAVALATRAHPFGPAGEAAAPGPTTFDGRDVFAPAVAALCTGAALEELGTPVGTAELARPGPPLVRRRMLGDGRQACTSEISWVDRFGNAQLALGAEALPEADGRAVSATTTGGSVPVRFVRAFGDLADGEVGLLVDANGRLALVVKEDSAARRLGLAAGDRVELAW